MKKIGLLFKEASKEHIKNNLEGSSSVLVIRYSGVSGPDLTSLRQSLKDYSATLFVIKNTIARRALKDSISEEWGRAIEGSCGLVFVPEDPTDVSRILYNFSREHQTLSLEGGFLKDRVLSREDIEKLARLPSKQILRTQVVWGIKAPLSGLTTVLSQTLRKFVFCLQEIKKKKTLV